MNNHSPVSDATSTPRLTWHAVPEQHWSSGGWQIDVRADELAHVRYAGHQIARGIRLVLRDADWKTPKASVTDITSNADELRISIDIDDLGISAHGLIVARRVDEALQLNLELEATAAFAANRVGLVAMLPPTLAGTPMRIEHPDGSPTLAEFPDRIAPHQPAKAIGALQWSTADVTTRASFSGDEFEMEDQRNWSDASFKVYTPPLERPFPRDVAAGEHFSQQIELDVSITDAADLGTAPHHIELLDANRAFPVIGVGASTAPERQLPEHADPSDLAAFVLVELDATASNWSAALARAARCRLPLDVRIIAEEGSQVRTVTEALARYDVARVGVFHWDSHTTTPELWSALQKGTAGWAAEAAELIGGTRAHFTELNRNHDDLPELPAYTFSVTPQMHAQEGDHILETIAQQYRIARDAATIADGPLHVGPVTLRPRFNAVATSPRPVEGDDVTNGYGAELTPQSTDPRQHDDGVAAWTIASAAALAAGGAESITYYEVAGPRGVITGSGTPSPASAALTGLHRFRDRNLLVQSNITDTAEVWAIGARAGQHHSALVANLTDHDQRVTVTVDGNSHDLHVPGLGWVVTTMTLASGSARQ